MKQFLEDHNLNAFAGRHSRLIGFLLCLAIIAGLVGFAASKVSNAVVRANDAKTLSRNVAGVAAEAKSLANEIQDERRASIRRACESTNARHDATIDKLDELIAKSPARRRARAEQQRASTVALLEAIVPHQDCDAAVQLAVKP